MPNTYVNPNFSGNPFEFLDDVFRISLHSSNADGSQTWTFIHYSQATDPTDTRFNKPILTGMITGTDLQWETTPNGEYPSDGSTVSFTGGQVTDIYVYDYVGSTLSTLGTPRDVFYLNGGSFQATLLNTPTEMLVDVLSNLGGAPSGTTTEGDDIITGTHEADEISALGGDDQVFGEGGNDTIFGNSGNDLLVGGDGNDSIHGGHGMDILVGGDGNDDLYGNWDNDEIYGGAGYDFIRGGDGDDTILGEGEDDYIEGGNGNDYIDGGSGYDTLFGGEGDDGIVYDAMDVAANVNGGNGVDTLIFNGNLDTSYDLVAGSFEFAVNHNIDNGNEFWATIDDTYNSLWQQISQVGTTDDGRSWQTSFDITNSDWFTSATNWFDANGGLTHTDYLSDAGNRVSQIFDVSDSQWWQFFTSFFDSNGNIINTDGIADDGRFWTAVNDVSADGSGAWWQSYTCWYDTADPHTRQLINEEGLADDGRTWITTYDVNNLYSWESQTNWFDANGDLIDTINV